MVEIRENTMSFKDELELAFSFLFLDACLSESEHDVLKAQWEEQGGISKCVWWEFIRDNVDVSLKFK